MANVKKLLVPIDFSPESKRALRYAVSLAKQFDAGIVALHVLDDLTGTDWSLPVIMPPEGWPYFKAEPPRRPIDLLLRERSVDLWNFTDRTLRGLGPTKVKRLVRLGSVRNEIAAVARQEKIDLLVFELRNRVLFRNFANRKLLRLIEHLPYPVLLAPPAPQTNASDKGKHIWSWQTLPHENPA